MKKSYVFFVLQILVFAIMASKGVGPVVATQDYVQTPIILNAKDILPQDLLQGENYKVEDKVRNDGLINTYHLSTNYGLLAVESTAELMIRITELNALKTMEEMDRKNVFGKALKEGVKAPVKGAVDLITSPIETTKGIFKGTGQFLSSVGRSFVSDDPHQDNALKVALGYDAAKRKFAYEFGIDPYSSYQPAMDRLGQIARAAVAGGITPRVAMASIDHKITTAMKISSTAKSMKKLVRDNPPGELEKINRKKLEQMGLDASLIEAFLDNYSYNPQEKTLLVGELESMKGVKGRDVFITVANLATEESVALYYRLIAQMMAGYHNDLGAATGIRNINGVLNLQGKDAALVLLAPVDFVFWTKELGDKLNAFESRIKGMAGISGKQVWIPGKMDKTARKHFETKGWKVTESANDILFKEKD